MFIVLGYMKPIMTILQVKVRPLSFSSSREMRGRTGLLPGTVLWKQVQVQVRGGVTIEPMTLYFRDALECFKCLFGNPLFSDYMDFIPRREYADEERTERLYNEIMTGDRVWTLQVSILAGEGTYYRLRWACACI